MRVRWIIVAIMTLLAVAGAGSAVFTLRPRSVAIMGAVLLSHSDPMDESPIAGVNVTVSDELALARAASDFSGYFYLQLRPGVRPGDLVTLQFRHPDYQPLDVQLTANDQLYIARLSPAHPEVRPQPTRPEVLLSHLVVRYTAEARITTNIGSGVRTFQVVNTGNIPCEPDSRCSPDGKWKATVGSVSLDAGVENEFRNARLSCIAGPCPFTRIESDRFSKGGRTIGATVLNWSDTTTFTLEAEVVQPQISNVIQRSYPIILGRRLNFTLPASAEGASIEAEVNGEQIVFPLGPTASLSWASCDVRVEKDQKRMYRCELKPAYAFKDRGGE